MRDRYGLRAMLVVALLALVCKVGVAQIGPRYVLELAPDTGPGAGSGTGTGKGSINGYAAMEQGRLQLLPRGLALLQFQGLRVLALAADAEGFSAEAMPSWPAADLLLLTPARAGRYAGLAPLAALGRMPVIVAEAAPGAASAAAVADLQLPAGSAATLHPMQTWDSFYLRKGKTRLRVTAMAGRPGMAGVGGFLLEVGNSYASYRVFAGCEALAAEEWGALAQRVPGADLALLPAGATAQLLALHRGGGAVPLAPDGGAHAFTPLRR